MVLRVASSMVKLKLDWLGFGLTSTDLISLRVKAVEYKGEADIYASMSTGSINSCIYPLDLPNNKQFTVESFMMSNNDFDPLCYMVVNVLGNPQRRYISGTNSKILRPRRQQ